MHLKGTVSPRRPCHQLEKHASRGTHVCHRRLDWKPRWWIPGRPTTFSSRAVRVSGPSLEGRYNVTLPSVHAVPTDRSTHKLKPPAASQLSSETLLFLGLTHLYLGGIRRDSPEKSQRLCGSGRRRLLHLWLLPEPKPQ